VDHLAVARRDAGADPIGCLGDDDLMTGERGGARPPEAADTSTPGGGLDDSRDPPPAARGLISATARASRTEGEIRTRMPRFAPENFDRNLALVEALSKVAAGKNASVAQIAFAWALSRGDDVVPLVGARRRDQLSEALAAANLRLSAADIAGLEAAMPADAVAGTRYLPAAMAHLDSEHAH
jgi:hypothetical protein